jgi:hypothetical protein
MRYFDVGLENEMLLHLGSGIEVLGLRPLLAVKVASVLLLSSCKSTEGWEEVAWFHLFRITFGHFAPKPTSD